MQDIFKALSDPNRRAILQLLGKHTMSAGEIASHFYLAKSTLSSHFNVLKNAGLIDEERNGTTIYYSLNLSVVEDAMASFMNVFGVGKTGKERKDEDKLEK
ncbi:MAG: winged helix-turn-helix transcriptional regulator [Dehalococcoidales bacterium]|nr:winged helix-turn-helix transcriptional regulator [Dehalococcoidales bacterium]